MLFLLVVISELVGVLALKATLPDRDQVKIDVTLRERLSKPLIVKGANREVTCRIIKRFCEKEHTKCVSAETGS